MHWLYASINKKRQDESGKGRDEGQKMLRMQKRDATNKILGEQLERGKCRKNSYIIQN